MENYAYVDAQCVRMSDMNLINSTIQTGRQHICEVVYAFELIVELNYTFCNIIDNLFPQNYKTKNSIQLKSSNL
jgi:hypothetical protein